MAPTIWIMQLYIDKSDNSNNLARVIIDSIINWKNSDYQSVTSLSRLGVWGISSLMHKFTVAIKLRPVIVYNSKISLTTS